MSPEGPEHEVGRLYVVFGASLYRYALMILADREAAEDVLQQVFVAVLAGGRARLVDPERYLRRAVRNGCYSARRERQVATRRNGGADDALLEDVPAAVPVSPDIRMALDATIRELPPDQREVLHLHSFEGRTFREISETTGDAMNTVASRYRYAIEKLRLAMAERKS
jgi:RNA polymerase sigma-70 factor (ECF subfamily)